MGITAFSKDMIRLYGGEERGIRHLLVGCQNMYDNGHYGQIAQDYYKGFGQDVVSIDITACNGSLEHDLRKPLPVLASFDFISQHGTLEHVESREGFYLAFKHLHEVLEMGGIIVHENPKTGNWPGHGNHYLTQDFYIQLAKLMDYDIVAIGENCAMGNCNDGYNIYAVLRKRKEEFISMEEFNKLPIFDT